VIEKHPREQRYGRIKAGIIAGAFVAGAGAFGVECLVDGSLTSLVNVYVDLAGVASGVALAPTVADRFVPEVEDLRQTASN
jgi:hypothetical protein